MPGFPLLLSKLHWVGGGWGMILQQRLEPRKVRQSGLISLPSHLPPNDPVIQKYPPNHAVSTLCALLILVPLSEVVFPSLHVSGPHFPLLKKSKLRRVPLPLHFSVQPTLGRSLVGPVFHTSCTQNAGGAQTQEFCVHGAATAKSVLQCLLDD